MTTRFLTAVAATAALVASGSPFAQSAPGLTREQVAGTCSATGRRLQSGAYEPAQLGRRRPSRRGRVQAGHADDARTQLAGHGATTRCD